MATEFELLRMWEIWKLRTRNGLPFREIGERLMVSACYTRTLFRRVDLAILQDEESQLKRELRDGTGGKTKKLKIVEIGGVSAPAVSSWEEEQQARAQGYENFHYLEKKKKKKKQHKHHRRFVLTDGSIFQCD